MLPGDFRGTGRFRVERRLGAGGFGVVYSARDTERDTAVALKTLRHLTPDSLYRFKREFRALAGLSHPNLVQLYELVSDADEWFFTMELVEGCSFLEYAWGCGRPPLTPIASPAAWSDENNVTQAASGSPEADPNATDDIEADAAGHPVSPADLPRLSRALRQLVRGVAALHQAGCVHRDLKPSNVLVTPSGRVVILDFGLVLDLDSGVTDRSLEIAGTPSYMSPEQAAGLPITPASDWYSLGVILYQALTGRLPFGRRGSADVIALKQQSEPQPASMVATGIPAHLDELCRDLLRRAAERRPKADEIMRRLGGVTAVPASRPTARATGVFVGREHHLAALQRAAEDAAVGPITVCVHGVSGIGKSALLRAFLERWREAHPEGVVLVGRCFERESVPYKALDSLIDSLARQLNRMEPAEAGSVMPRDFWALTQVFPVLQQLEARLPERRRPAVPDSQEIRRRAFGALRELLARIADHRPAVLVIDDLQWGDLDSVDLLRTVLRGTDAPAILVVVSYRSDEAQTSPCLRAWLSQTDGLPGLRELRVEGLSALESRTLAAALLTSRARTVAAAATIAAEAGGSPFFIDELVRAATALEGDSTGATVDAIDQGATADRDVRETSLTRMIGLRVARLPAAAREVLELVAVNGQPISMAVLRRAAESAATEGAMALLTAEHFLRTRETGHADEFETYHDRIREAVIAGLSSTEERRLHRALAVAIEAVRGADAEGLAEHYLAAGEAGRAIEHTMAAARTAETALAFDRAAAQYRRALELLPPSDDRWASVVRHLGEALINAGRGAEAAEVLLSVAGDDSADRLQLRARAAQQYLVSGHIDEGLAVLREVLQSIGRRMPETYGQTMRALALGRLRVRLRGLSFRERPAVSVPADRRLEIDASWAVATGLASVDTLRGALFQSLNLIWALEAGETRRAARALALEAGYSAIGGSRSRRRTQRVLAQAARLAERAATPYTTALMPLMGGIIGHLEGRWRDSVELSDRAERLFRETCTGVTWEIDNAWFFNLGSRYYCGDLRTIATRCPELIKEAESRGDLYAGTILGAMLVHYVHLMNDAPGEVVRDAQQAIRRWSRLGFHIQHMWEFWSTVDAALYEGNATLAWRRVLDTWPALRSSPVLHVQFTRVNVLDLRGKAALAAVTAVRGSERTGLLRDVERTARRLERERVEWARLLALMLRAGVAAVQGRADPAIRTLLAAEQMADTLDMPLHRAVARDRRGELEGVQEGAGLRRDTGDWLAAQGVREPAKFIRVLAPW